MVANKNGGSQFSEKNVSNAHLIKVCLAHVKEQSPGRVLACVFPLRSERQLETAPANFWKIGIYSTSFKITVFALENVKIGVQKLKYLICGILFS